MHSIGEPVGRSFGTGEPGTDLGEPGSRFGEPENRFGEPGSRLGKPKRRLGEPRSRLVDLVVHVPLGFVVKLGAIK